MIERPTSYPPNGIPYKDRLKTKNNQARDIPEPEEGGNRVRDSWIKRLLNKIRLTK